MSVPPIVIAGAGIAGLTLGRCLLKKNIPTLIIEKASSSPRSNYGITLHAWAYQPLLPVLQMDEATFREELSIDANRGESGATSGNVSSACMATTPETFRCHRGRLEQLLKQGLDIKWEHQVKDIKTSDQILKIDILGEEPIESTLLIGADGVHSQIRKSLAPGVQVGVLPYVVFYGTRRLAPDEYKNSIEPKMQGCSIIQSRSDDVLLRIAINNFLTDAVDIGYTYSRPARLDDPLHRPDRPNLGAHQIPEAFYAELGCLKQLEQAFAEVFNAGSVRKDRVLHWLMRSTLGTEQLIKKMADRGVLLVGDAVHAMPILGGEGGNHAMKDGVDLAEHIAVHGPQGTKTFSAERYEIWKRGVEQSEERLAELHSSARAFL